MYTSDLKNTITNNFDKLSQVAFDTKESNSATDGLMRIVDKINEISDELSKDID